MQIIASLPHNNTDSLKSHLGTFLYYHFLQDFFEDISKFHRDGDITFCKPGIGDLCIRWNVFRNEHPETIRRNIIDGLENISVGEKQKYWEKYSLANSLNFIEDDDINVGNKSLLVTVEATCQIMHKTAVNAGWTTEA